MPLFFMKGIIIMCTSIALNNNGFYFGRTLDLVCGFNEQVVFTPCGFDLKYRLESSCTSHYSILGMAAVIDSYPLYADAFNEKGLCMAGLNFPDNAFYSPDTNPSKHNISPFELIPWILSQCGSVTETEQLLAKTHITAVPFSEKVPLSPLHWHIADKERSIVLESTADGVKIFSNPVGVMTNNPTFDFHLTNLNQYMSISSGYPESRFGQTLEPFSNGFGGLGLPGDYSSCSRFVRAAFLAANSECEKGEEISQFFRIAEGVSLPRGSVKTKEKHTDYTIYSCCMDPENGIYYYRTYSNSRISAVSSKNPHQNGNSLVCFPLNRAEDIYFV